MIIREAAAEDIAAITAIYGHHVLNGTGTFEEVPPTEGEMAKRRAAVAEYGLPYLIAEAEGQVLGFAYAGPFRTRSAYRYTAEDSVYVAPDHQGRGVGKALLLAVIEACEKKGLRQLMAVIGDSDNKGSIGVHAACGFEHSGVSKSVGFKQGRFLDVVHMQRALGGEGAPEGPGLAL